VWSAQISFVAADLGLDQHSAHGTVATAAAGGMGSALEISPQIDAVNGLQILHASVLVRFGNCHSSWTTQSRTTFEHRTVVVRLVEIYSGSIG
jgi:hypothetical protein